MSDYGITEIKPKLELARVFSVDGFREENVKVYDVKLKRHHLEALADGQAVYFSVNDNEYGFVLRLDT